MQPLNFPTYKFRFKSRENKVRIFDEIRKIFVVLQPEEWVRQHAIQYLLQEKKYPKGHINVEKQLTLHNLKKRYDIVVYNSDGSIEILVECKSPGFPITQTVFDQIARYNLKLNAHFLMVTNGMEHFYCQLNYGEEKYTFLEHLPEYRQSENPPHR